MPDLGKVAYDLTYKLQNGINTRSTYPTFVNGKLTKVEEKEGTNIIKTSVLNYDTNGVLIDITDTFDGRMVKQILNYTNGILSSVTKQLT